MIAPRLRRLLQPVAILLRPLLLGFGVGMILLAAGTLYHIHAPWVRANDPAVPGAAAAVPTSSAADVVLAISSGAIAAAADTRRFATLDLSWGWANLVAQEVGPFRVLDLDEPLPHPFPAPAVLIWSGSACRRSDAGWTGWLREQVAAGATLLLEMPAGDLAALGGFVPASAAAVEERRLVPAADGPLGPLDAAALAGLDLPVRVQPGEITVDAEVLLRAGERPAAFARALGGGRVVTLLFDAARLVTSIQQGTPGDDLVVRNRYPDRLAPRLESNDLVISPALLENEVPVADLLERLLAGWLEDERPLPAWWGYPGGAAGAFLMTHDDEGFGGKARWMTEHERRIGAVSTSYFMPSGQRLLPEDAVATAADGSEIGLHWDRTAADGARADRTLGPLRLLHVERGLAAQLEWLRQRLPAGQPVRASRVHFLEWDATWSGTLAKLAAVGIAVDSTYGLDLDCRGYLFGTGRPFRPLDGRGLPLPLLEVPHVGSEDLGGFDAEALERLLASSRDGRHQAITVLFHPVTYGWRPSVALFDHWKRSYERAASAEHVSLTMSGLAGFEAARAASPLTSVWKDGRLEIRGRAGRADLALALPLAAGGRTLTEIRSAAGALKWDRTVRMGRDAALVVVPAGEFVLGATYAPVRP